MTSFYKAIPHGECVSEMQDCQGPAPSVTLDSDIGLSTKQIDRTVFYKRVRSKIIHLTKERQLYHEQTGISTLTDKLRLIGNLANVSITEQSIDIVENIFLIFMSLQDVRSRNISNSTSTVLLASKVLTKRPLSVMAKESLSQFVDYIFSQDIPAEQAGEPDWFSSLSDINKNWESMKNNSGFSRISKLLSLSAALGLCGTTDLKWDFHGIRLFSLNVQKRHVSAQDFISAILDTVTYFVETGYRCLQAGSIDPIFYQDDKAKEFDDLYLDIQEMFVHAKSSNLTKVKIPYKGKQVSITENDFSMILDDAIDSVNTLLLSVSSSWEKKVLNDRARELRKMRADWQTLRVNGKLREAPFAVYIEGTSGVGKSTVSAILMRCLLNCIGESCDDDRIISVKEADKFDSNLKSSINGFFIDDIGNAKADFVERSPTAKLIDFNNNMPMYANMAEADMKGKVAIEPKVLIATSNVHLSQLARVYSNEPFSIVRRMDYHITVRVKDEYRRSSSDARLDSTKVLKKFPGDPLPDIWEFSVSQPEEGSSTLILPIGTYNLQQLVEFLSTQIKLHKQHQQTIVSLNTDLGDKLQFCGQCQSPSKFCSCIKEEQAGEYIIEKLNSAKQSISTKKDVLVDSYYDYVQSIDSSYFHFINYIPDFVLFSRFGNLFMLYLSKNDILKIEKSLRSLISFCFIFTSVLGFSINFWFLLLLSWFAVLYIIVLYFVQNHCVRKISSTKCGLKLFASLRNRDVTYICSISAAVASLYLLSRMWKKMYKLQGKLSPTNVADIDERDIDSNPWTHAVVNPLHVSEASKTTIFHDLVKKSNKSLTNVILGFPSGDYACNALFVCSNVALFPNHIFKKYSSFQATFVKYSTEKNGSTFRCPIDLTAAVRIPNTDMILVYVPSGGSWPNLLKFFAHDKIPSSSGILSYKDSDGSTLQSDLYARTGKVKSTAGIFQGSEYTLDFQTFVGLCGAAVVRNTASPVIEGIHLGGYSGAPQGMAGFVTQQQLNLALEELRTNNSVMIGVSNGTIPTQRYDVQFFQSPTVHNKSPVNFLPTGNNFSYFGEVMGRSSFTSSEVESTVISDAVTTVMDQPNIWGPPKFHRWKPWQAALEKSSNPSPGFLPEALEWAVEDYLRPLKTLMVDPRFNWQQDTKPLTKMQTLAGVDGKRFIDKMPPNTSVGYPLVGPKKDFLVNLDPKDYPDFSCPVELDQQFWDMADTMKEAYLRGERAYPMFKACLKDEATKLSKDKVRVFQACDMACQLLLRMYFLPIARFLSMNPLVSECAVGINSMGPEWDELMSHVEKYGKDRILAGDYASYDLRMPAQITLASFRIYIELAKLTGNYTSDDLKIMEGLAFDNAYPTIAYNGDLLMLHGSTPSGTNLTVYLNCTDNSLLHRIGYYNIVGGESSYQDNVSSTFYGDDAKSSVSESIPQYNHISFANFLSDHDMTFTMPDKTSTPTQFMHTDDADFLKRKNVVIPELGARVGALDEMSIFKSLHSVLHTKSISREDQAAQNIDGALREWFAHGRIIYEKRREQLKIVASECNLVHIARELNVSYDERLAAYQEKYLH